jgi:hypothetical protein
MRRRTIMNNAIKYEFRGFRILKIDYNRIKDQPITSFSMGTKKNRYDENAGIYELITEFEFNFGEEKSIIVFSSGFKIVDNSWVELMAEQVVVNELFKIAYPYFAQKIQAITSDFRAGVVLPVFDMKRFDFTKKIVFNLGRSENKKAETEEIN